MSELQFTTVDRIFSKLHRELKGTDLNETDVIEWIGEALDHLKVAESQEQAVRFLKVKNNHAEVPKGFQMVLQIARDNEFIVDEEDLKTIVEYLPEGTIASSEEDAEIDYSTWTNSPVYKDRFTPVRLANSTLFNTLVCKEKITDFTKCEDEYTIVGDMEKKLRFSFEEGRVAIAYLKTHMCEETGYPLIPDDIRFITAITYYIKWKIAEWYQWNRREGYDTITQDNERKWKAYARQSKNRAKMPKSLDDYQDLLEQTHYLVPKHKKYYGFFGNLGKAQNLNFNI